MNKYVLLNNDISLKHINNQLFLYNYRKNLLLEAPLSCERFFLLCDGSKKLEELKKLNIINNNDINELIQEDIINLSNKPHNKKLDYIYYSKNFLKHISIDITNKCNLNCKHCYISNLVSKRSLNIREIKKVLLEAKKMGCLSVELSGGEPFARKDLLNILKIIVKCRVGVVAILTNGVYLDNKVLNFLKTNKINTEFYISLDGLKRSHEKFRGKKDIYEKIISNINKLVNSGFRITISTSLNKYNINEFEELFEFIKHIGIRRWRVTSPFYSGNWIKNKQNLGVNIDDELNLYQKLIEKWINEEPSFILECGNIFRSSEFSNKQQKYNINSYCCDYYRNSCSIKCNGDVISCGIHHPHFICGNIRGTSFNKIWESKKMRTFKNLKIKDLLKHNKECKKCDLLWFCGLGCRFKALTLNGDANYLDTYMCEITKKYFKRNHSPI